jgi:hypothetical protein
VVAEIFVKFDKIRSFLVILRFFRSLFRPYPSTLETNRLQPLRLPKSQKKCPQGLKPILRRVEMYGLKPVPFKDSAHFGFACSGVLSTWDFVKFDKIRWF